MKGIILAGDPGHQLDPLTKITGIQLLPVYDRPLIWYPLNTLLKAGMKDILIIVPSEYAGHFLHFLGSGKEYGARFTYEVQDKPTGLPEAFVIGEKFIDGDSVTMVLGNNIFENDFSRSISGFVGGGKIFAKKVPDPSSYGVVKLDSTGMPLEIIEKPQEFVSPYANVGIYIYDQRVIDIAKSLKPSARGETEITDISNWYIRHKELEVETIEGAWFNVSDQETLLEANNWVAQRRSSEDN